MQPETTICQKRRCKHYMGSKILDKKADLDFIFYCRAFPLEDGGIPDVILNGKNKHLKPLSRQKNNIVYKKV